MSELSDKDKDKVMVTAFKILLPIIEKYELEDSKNEQMALIEAFQAGIKYAVELKP